MGQGSAWLNIIERDKSNYVPSTQYIEKAQFFIVAKQGVVNKPILIKDQGEFNLFFGTANPTETGHLSSLVAWNFLSEYPAYIMRIQKNATYAGAQFTFDMTNGSIGQGLSASTPTDLTAFTLDKQVNLAVFEKYQGQWGNGITVKFTPTNVSNSIYQNAWKMDVISKDGTLLESFTVSEDPNLVDEYGNTYYITERVKESNYITVIINETNKFDFNSIIPTPQSKIQSFTYDGTHNTFTLTKENSTDTIISVASVEVNTTKIDKSQYTFSSDMSQVTVNGLSASDGVKITFSYITEQDTSKLNVQAELSGGTDGEDLTDLTNQDNVQQIIDAIQAFKDDEEYDFAYLVNGGWVNPQIQSQMVSICSERKDQVAILDTPDLIDVGDVISYVNGMNVTDSHAQIFYPWLVTNNPFNGIEMHVPPTFEVSKNFVRVDSNLGYHYAVAGLENGSIYAKDVTIKLKKSDRDNLYDARINPIQKFTNVGLFVWGNKTLQGYFSKLDRLTARRVVSLAVIKWAKRELKQFIFSPNNANTVSKLNSLLSTFARDLQMSGQVEQNGIRYRIEDTPALRDQNTINIYIDLIPVGQIEYINLFVTVYPSGQFTITTK